jgi:hypothetical protein
MAGCRGESDGGIKAILGNPVMINAYKEGIPGNGKPFPEGSMIVKIECFVHREGFQEIPGHEWMGICPVFI